MGCSGGRHMWNRLPLHLGRSCLPACTVTFLFNLLYNKRGMWSQAWLRLCCINKRRLSVWVFHSYLHLGRFIGVHPKEAVTNLDLTLGQFIYFSQTLLMLFSLKPHSLLCIKNIIAMITADLSINSCSPPQTQLNYTLVQVSEGCNSEIKDWLNLILDDIEYIFLWTL